MVPCTATDDRRLDLLTSAETVVPGAVPEFKRSIWALDRVEVFDGGPDSDADTLNDNSLFCQAARSCR